MLPYKSGVSVFADAENFRTTNRRHFEHIDGLAKFTTAALRRACGAEGDCFSDEERAQFSRLLYKWTRSFCRDMELMREVRHYGTNSKNTLGSHVFIELTRLYMLTRWSELAVERDNLANYDRADLSTDTYLTLFALRDRTAHPMWISLMQSVEPPERAKDAKGNYIEDEDVAVEQQYRKMRAMWDKPIMQYTQSDTRTLVMFLTQQLDEVTGACMDEYRAVYEVLWLRIGELLVETHPPEVLDEEELRVRIAAPSGDSQEYCFNRLFATFVAFYMGEIMRRFFYYDLLRNNVLPLGAPALQAHRERVRGWVAQIVRAIPDDAFDDLYARVAADEAYTFVGDDAWFKYAWPSQVHSRGACIVELRPHLYKRYYSEAQVTKDAVLAAVPTSLASRLFVLAAVDVYIGNAVPNTHWRDSVVIPSDAIEDEALKLQRDMAPLLVQTFSNYCAYDAGCIHVSDDLYESLAVWFMLLRGDKYGGKLFGSDMGELLEEVLGPASADAPASAHPNDPMEIEL